MLNRFSCRAVLVASLALFVSPALAAAEDDYVTYRTAAAINAACGGLKYLEHTRTLGAAQQALTNTRQNRLSLDGRLPEDEYKTWLAALDKKAADQAAAVGCTEPAMQFIMRGKGAASEAIYRGLALSAHFASQTDVLMGVPVEPDRWAALQRYDAYLQAIYRENFAAFAARQKEIAAQELPMVNPFETDFGLGLSMIMSPEDSNKIFNAQSIAAYALDEVFFEVSAEMAGFIVRPILIQDTWTIPELRAAAAAAQPGLPVVDGPRYDLIDLTPEDGDDRQQKLYSLIVLTPENRLRVMYYGDAANLLGNPTVRLYVRNEPLPAGASAFSYFESPGFREKVTAFEGTRVEGGCLTAACFEFPPAATDLFVADKDNQYAELFVSPVAGSEPPALETISYKSGRTSNFFAYKLLRE